MAIGRESVEKLLKFKSTKWKTSITRIESNKISIRGYPLEDLIGTLSFPEMIYLLIIGNLPSKKEAMMLEAILVSFSDHGVTPPSTQVARLMASTGSPLNNCISGGILSFGKHHAGALENCMKLLQEGVKDYTGSIDSPKDIKKIAEVEIEKFIQNNRKIPGFGHRYHDMDPRAPKLIEVAQKYGFCGIHTQLALAIQEIISEIKGIKMNVDGANAGILSDMAFDWQVGSGIFMIGRLPGLISHIYEEKTREPPFRKFFGVDEIYYNGVEERILSKGLHHPKIDNNYND